jgi:ribonuclease P protein component, eubacterial
MKKKNVVKSNQDFNRIIQNNKPYKYKDYVIYIEKIDSNEYHFGVSVSKKIGNAVVRNKLKRQIRSIISKKDYQKKFNCIIILGRGILERSYQEMEDNLIEAFKKLDIYC